MQIIKEANLTRKEVEAVHDEEDANKTRQKTDGVLTHRTISFESNWSTSARVYNA